jgi:hypothetical protein
VKINVATPGLINEKYEVVKLKSSAMKATGRKLTRRQDQFYFPFAGPVLMGGIGKLFLRLLVKIVIT